MVWETNAAVKLLFESSAAQEHFAQDESLPSHAQRVLNTLRDTYQQLFDSVAPKIADDFVSEVDESNRLSMQQMLAGAAMSLGGMGGAAVSVGGSTLSVGIFPTVTLSGKRVNTILEAAVKENVSLIKSIPREYLGQIEKVVHRSMTTGRGANEIYEAAKEHLELSKSFKSHLKNTAEKVDRRAKFIATDQTHKVSEGLTEGRMRNAGLDEFIWSHTAGSLKPRPYHLNVLNGKKYSLSDPPIIDPRTGERGLPGQLANCRCKKIPVFVQSDLEGYEE